ncbi:MULTISPECIES: mycofactocin-coupled SDR family oxidoreductase [unclassified Parafrankia]|uniref:mycofactocin-coupled SDR family oxidoreductase n=1 Tax=unclassified Parafrankia TaxID=2994368 RepID=UPI000DA431E8|nr:MULTISPECIES: mycofactocin-coupled SDR family oxidoreductase [unclassified Parafrankia]TCJ33504.1 NAD(P)-dependent oxidoreductase [Parafrankia sp. BMG5.11]SQD97724.1 (-)-trans-carveol dehydrogenase [Parafrankia sp. Ea1.12]
MSDAAGTPGAGRVAGKAALVTGAARGQGRSHALRLAAEGADVILLDAVSSIENIEYPMPDSSALETVAKEVRALGRRAVAVEADVRDLDAVAAGTAAGVAELGRLDILVANAGVLGRGRQTWEFSREEWDTVVDINLTGVWTSVRAAVPHMIEAGNGGSVVLVSSIAGLRGIPGVSNYSAAKHGLVGLAASLANEVARHGVRVNTVHPTNVHTPMIDNPASARMFSPGLENPDVDDTAEVLQRINLFPIPWVEVEDVSAVVLWLSSDESRYVTGAAIPVDAGMLVKYNG